MRHLLAVADFVLCCSLLFGGAGISILRVTEFPFPRNENNGFGTLSALGLEEFPWILVRTFLRKIWFQQGSLLARKNSFQIAGWMQQKLS
jgi:hypothetical protein